MAFQSTHRSAQALQMRFMPLLAWAFLGFASYGIGTIIYDVATGRTVLDNGIVFALLALGTMVVFIAWSGSQFVIANFDAQHDRFRITRYDLRGRSIREHPLSEIVGIEIRFLRRALHRIEIQLRSGERVALTEYYVVGLSDKGVKRLSLLLGLEPKYISPPARRWG
jgi:hypothetical protein